MRGLPARSCIRRSRCWRAAAASSPAMAPVFREASCPPTGSSTSGAASATAARRAPRKPCRRRPTTSTRGNRLRRKWRRAGSWPRKLVCRSKRLARPSAPASSWCAWRTIGRGSAWRTRRICTSRAPPSAPIRTPCVNSSWAANRPFDRSRSCSAAIPPPPCRSHPGYPDSPVKCRWGCPPNCWSGAPTSWPPSGASRWRSIGLGKPRRRACRRSP